MPALSARVAGASAGAIVAQTSRARALRQAGHDVISLAVGEPDFPTPARAIEAAHRAAMSGDTKYPPVEGTRALRQAAMREFSRAGLDVAFEQVLVTNGGKQAIWNALMATVDPGDEAIVLAPYWGAYPLMVRAAGGVPVRVATRADFSPDPEAIAQAITTRTKWLMLNFPGNPSGAVLDAQALEAVAAVLRRAPHVWALSDDLYAHLRFDGQANPTLAAVAPDLADRVLTVSGVSKTYAMTGWRIGFCAGPLELIRAMAVMQAHATAGVSTVGQAAAVAALDAPDGEIALAVATYRERRDLIVGALRQAGRFAVRTPEGAFYAFAGIDAAWAGSDEAFCAALLDEAHVAGVPGSAFGMPGHVRFSFACDTARLRQAGERIGTFCAALR